MATSDDPRRSTPWHGGDPDARAASDPSTSAGELARIARVRPDLHAALAANPSTYPELVEWLSLSPEPAVQAALRTRTATAGIMPAPGSPPDAPAPPHAPAPGVPKHRSRHLLTATLGVALVLALVGGGSAWWFLGRRSVPATSTDLLPVPSDDWADGAEEAWTVSLDGNTDTSGNSPDGNSHTANGEEVAFFSSSHHMATLSVPESASTLTLTTWDISGPTPEELWSGPVEPGAGAPDAGGADLATVTLESGILGSRTIVGDVAVDMRTGRTTPVPWPRDSSPTFFGDGLVVACADPAGRTECSGYGPDLAELWSIPDMHADLQAVRLSLLGGAVASDGRVRIMSDSGGSGLVVIDLLTGTTAPAAMPSTIDDTSELSLVTALRDGWAQCTVALPADSCFVWNADGELLTSGGLPYSNMVTSSITSAGGTTTAADWIHMLGGTPSEASSMTITHTGDECDEFSIDGTVFPDQSETRWALSDDEGTCQFGYIPFPITVSSGGLAAFRSAFTNSTAEILSRENGVVWSSGPTDDRSRLVRPDLLLAVDLGDSDHTVTAYRPSGPATGGTPTTVEHASPTPTPTGDNQTLDSSGESGPLEDAAANGAEAAEGEPESTPPVEGAYAGAGGPVPAGATEVTTIDTTLPDHPTAVIITPSGNIGCDISAGWTGCGVLSLFEDKTYGETEIGPRWVVSFGDGEPTLESSAARLTFMITADPVQVLEYGDVVYFEHTVCASAQNGLTCWDTVTGHGAFLSRARVETF